MNITHRQSNILVGLVVFLLVVIFGNRIDPDQPAVGKTLAIAAVMAVFWITEAIPLSITALFPLALFPLFGIMKGGDVAPLYINNVIFLFVGGFLVALAMERWNLHRRIALKVILVVGRSPTRLLLGFMLGSWALSMWISNTATAMMMVPIIIALLAKLEESCGKEFRKLEVGLLLGVAYGASIGGMATLIGTPPNLAFARIYAISFPNAPEVTFLYWLALGVPISIVLFIATFLVLRNMFTRRLAFEMDPTILDEEYRSLGKTSFEEKVVLSAFFALALLLVTRSNVTIGSTVIRGWASLFGNPSFIDDGTVAISIAVALFLIPSRKRAGFIMDKEMIQRLPWGIVLLFGGGFALAKGFQVSGLSAFLGGKLTALHGMHPLLIVVAICTLITFLTELTSNTATTQVVLPIIASLSAAVGVPPLLLMVPATIAASCAFMLPVATPPNAIVFGTDRLRVADMARVGFRLNLIAIAIVSVMVYAMGRFFF